MKKILNISVIIITIFITLLTTSCNKDKFNFLSKEEIVNSFTNYELEFTVTSDNKINKYLIKEDGKYIFYQVNNGMKTLFDKNTKMKYCIKFTDKTKAMYISSEDVETDIENIKNKYLVAHLGIANNYKKVEDQEVNGILCDVYTRTSDLAVQTVFVSKQEGYCVKTYVENQGQITSYEVLKCVKGETSCEEYMSYTNTVFTPWPDHELVLTLPFLRSGDYKSSNSEENFLEIVHENITKENVLDYVFELKEYKYQENIEEVDTADYYAYVADNKIHQVIIEYQNNEIKIQILKLEQKEQN